MLLCYPFTFFVRIACFWGYSASILFVKLIVYGTIINLSIFLFRSVEFDVVTGNSQATDPWRGALRTNKIKKGWETPIWSPRDCLLVISFFCSITCFGFFRVVAISGLVWFHMNMSICNSGVDLKGAGNIGLQLLLPWHLVKQTMGVRWNPLGFCLPLYLVLLILILEVQGYWTVNPEGNYRCTDFLGQKRTHLTLMEEFAVLELPSDVAFWVVKIFFFFYDTVVDS